MLLVLSFLVAVVAVLVETCVGRPQARALCQATCLGWLHRYGGGWKSLVSPACLRFVPLSGFLAKSCMVRPLPRAPLLFRSLFGVVYFVLFSQRGVFVRGGGAAAKIGREVGGRVRGRPPGGKKQQVV